MISFCLSTPLIYEFSFLKCSNLALISCSDPIDSQISCALLIETAAQARSEIIFFFDTAD
jgi:hypothetical protein